MLVKDRSNSVLIHVAGNAAAGTPMREAALANLASSKDASARRVAAAGLLTPVECLVALAGDEELEVVIAVARNEATPATSRTAALERLPSFHGSRGSQAAAENPATPLAVMQKLALHTDKSVLLRLAMNPSAPLALRASLSEILCMDPDPAVRESMAKNEATPARMLVEMAAKDFWLVRLAAIHNPAFPSDRGDAALAALSDEVRASLEPKTPFVADDLSPEDFAAPFAVLGLTPDDGDRHAIAKAAKAKDWVQRAAACLCDGITPGELNRLLDDEVDMVKQLAICRLRALQARGARKVTA